MEHLDHPSAAVWAQRQAWFERVEESARGEGSYFVSEQACALSAEVQSAFCAGAWVATLFLAMAVVDAALRETEAPGFTGNTRDLLDLVGADPRLQRLRKRRNALVHVDPNSPALTVDQQWSDRSQLEAEAREAVELMFGAFYLSPGS
jgi:hypothetical protein